MIIKCIPLTHLRSILPELFKLYVQKAGGKIPSSSHEDIVNKYVINAIASALEKYRNTSGTLSFADRFYRLGMEWFDGTDIFNKKIS
jgi:hypothetical protein